MIDRHDDEPLDRIEETARRFPWRPVAVACSAIAVHLLLLFVWIGIDPTGRRLVEAGGLVSDRLRTQPWRLLTYMTLHSGTSHVLWNGVSMLVFATPLILRAGYLRSGVIYLVAGVAGGIAGLIAGSPGSVTVGSFAAVAGLFGAWVVVALERAAGSNLPTRARIRVAGIALLFLPSLLSPTTSTGQLVNVQAHLGGACAGVIAGLVCARAGLAIREIRTR